MYDGGEKTGTGRLSLCATPIGNLEDITERVLRTLREADCIAAEDTRESRKLLSHYGIHTPLTSYHEHNKYEKAEALIARMERGEHIALITDAGTPAVSDPGEVLAARCIERGIRVSALPGACALITALAASGMPARRFCFEGFLPADKKERRRVLSQLAEEERTILLYEAPHRLRATLSELRGTLGGERRVVLCRELTKRYEELLPFTLSSACAYYDGEAEPRGEYVLVLAGADPAEKEEKKQAESRAVPLAEQVAAYEAEGLDRREAMRQAARARGVSRREVYRELTEDREKERRT